MSARQSSLKDEQLYTQGLERPEGEFCSICTLPIPLPINKHSTFNVCCTKRVCKGCVMAAKKRGMNDCPFCRTPMPENCAGAIAMIMARVEKKDPVAINLLGDRYLHGMIGGQKDMEKAIQLFAEAAELGSIEALFFLGVAYYNGGLTRTRQRAPNTTKKRQCKDMPRAGIGLIEVINENYDRAGRHFLISAKMGCELSLNAIKSRFKEGRATRAQYAEALRGYQDAIEEMKSRDRDEAKRLEG